MNEKVKCAICGKDSNLPEKVVVNKFLEPNSEGAKLYFDLWHFDIQKCDNCGYVSRDITKCANVNIINSKLNINQKIIDELQSARANQIENYIVGSLYYESIGDHKSQALCLIQAGDLVYNEILYWKEYVLTEDETCEDFYSFANNLYNKGTSLLKDYIETNPIDIDMQLLFAGIMLDGEDNEILIGRAMLQKIENLEITYSQKLILDFLKTDI